MAYFKAISSPLVEILNSGSLPESYLLFHQLLGSFSAQNLKGLELSSPLVRNSHHQNHQMNSKSPASSGSYGDLELILGEVPYIPEETSMSNRG